LNEETVRRGVRELESGDVLAAGRVRRVGAGKRPVAETHPGIEMALEALVDPVRRGDPCSALRWASKSAAKLAAALAERGFAVMRAVVIPCRQLGQLPSLKANGAITRSPRLTFWTSAPTSSTTPMNSCPMGPA
jgi:hypothetical protein